MALPVELTNPIILSRDDFNETQRLMDDICQATYPGTNKLIIPSQFSETRINYWTNCYDHGTNIATIKSNSIFWLFFWADTARTNKEEAITLTRQLFSDIFICPYEEFSNALHNCGVHFKLDGSDGLTEKEATTIRRKLRPAEGNTKYTDEILNGVIKKLNENTAVKGETMSANTVNNLNLYAQLLESNYNLIFTGAPGTGKTYLAKQMAIKMIFPEKDETELKEENLSDEEKKVFLEHYSFVQFHPSYDYTDFVEGLRAEETDSGVTFRLHNGTFKAFCKKAISENAMSQENPRPYIFVIDEINRGEISKIFGELFFSIDPGYRGKDGKVMTQYANIQDDETIFDPELGKGWFYVPGDVYIIGTMNDIDRSVESFDFAMRRRFVWQEITAEESAKNMNLLEETGENSVSRMKSLNDEIEKTDGLGRHYQVGAAYFMKLKSYKLSDGGYVKLWSLHLNPLLQEYVRALPESKEILARLKAAYDLKASAE